MKRSWKAGIAVVDITPPIGIELAGYVAREQGSIGIHDNLCVRALVLEDGANRAAILTCDLLGIDADDGRFVRGRIQEKTGIPAANIMIAASHTHAGPSTLHTIGIGQRDEHWISILLDKIIMCAVNAAKTLEPVLLKVAAGTVEIGINRRGIIPEGEINPLPDPAGPVDREVTALCVEKVSTKKAWIILFNCGCHPTVLGADNRLVSADYVGAAVRHIERSLGDNTIAMFTNGGAGNVNPIQTGSFGITALLGERLGTSVVNLALQQMREVESVLDVSNVTVDLPLARVSSRDEAREFVRRYTAESKGDGTASVPKKIAEACLSWSKMLESIISEQKIPTKITIEVQRLRLGDVSLIGVPAEVFAETAIALKQEGPGRTILVGYANGNVGYLPPGEEFSKGGYEVLEAHKYYGNPAQFAPEAEARVREIRTIMDGPN